MMSVRIQIFLLVFLILLLGVIISMVKKRQLELKYVLVWMACDVVLIVFTCFPGLMDQLAELLGIYSPMNMIFFIGFVLILLILFSLTVTLSRVTARVRRIAQILALLPEDLKKDIMDEIKK